MIDRNQIAMIQMILKGFIGLFREEHRQRDLLGTLYRTIRKGVPTYRNDRTVGQELNLRAQRHPYKVFVSYGTESWTYSEIDERAAKVAHRLREILPDRGCVGIMAGNGPEYLEVFFATQKAALTCVPINRSLKSEGLAHILNDSAIDVLFIDPDLYPEIQLLKDKLPQIKLIVAFERRGKAPDETVPYRVFLEGGDGAIKDGIKPDPKTTSLMIYTSGTTGLPKGVAYRYGEASQIKLMRFFAHCILGPQDVYYSCLPLFHANALVVTTLGVLNVGGRLVLADRFSASNYWRELRANGVTIANTFTSMIPILIKQPPSRQDRIHKVSRILDSGVPRESWEAFEKRFGVRIIESYGAVDGGGLLMFNMGYAPSGSLGKPMPGIKYKLVDEQGREVGIGEPGEMVHKLRKGDMKFEYHKNQEASRQKVREGWVYSGDLMVRDQRGYLYFVGRGVDAIRRRGENISAMEVESAVSKHPDVLECAVYGVPAELGEDEVMVSLVPLNGSQIDPMGLVEFQKDHLPNYAIPRYVDVVGELPKTETHRVRKNVLKERGVTETTWDREKEMARDLSPPASR